MSLASMLIESYQRNEKMEVTVINGPIITKMFVKAKDNGTGELNVVYDANEKDNIQLIIDQHKKTIINVNWLCVESECAKDVLLFDKTNKKIRVLTSETHHFEFWMTGKQPLFKDFESEMNHKKWISLSVRSDIKDPLQVFELFKRFTSVKKMDGLPKKTTNCLGLVRLFTECEFDLDDKPETVVYFQWIMLLKNNRPTSIIYDSNFKQAKQMKLVHNGLR